jgi:4-hydroxy-4-methyl-2-oxoglutarate aldolase
MGAYSIGEMPPPLPEAVSARFNQVETATIGHLRHFGFMNPAIRPVSAGRRVVGAAITLALPAHDSTLLHYALGLTRPGDVIVIDRLGDEKYACWGGGVTNAAQKARVAGAIVDGPCTDPSEIRDRGFGLWCRGVSPITTRVADVGGKLNLPVVCGGVTVRPGDIILADESGVVVLDPDEAVAVAEAALARQAASAERMRAVDGGARLGDLSGATELVKRSLEGRGK